MLILTPAEVRHVAVGVLLRCQQLRRDGLPVPADLAQLRDQLTRAAQGGQDLPPIEPLITSPQPVAVNFDEAARLLSVSERSIRRMVSDGRLAVVRIGRRRLVARAEIERLTEGRVA